MKLLIVLALVAAFAFIYPVRSENNGDSCGALASRVAKLLSARAVAGIDDAATLARIRAAGGTLAATAIKQYLPQLPPALACTALYWKLTLDTKAAEALLAERGRLPAP